MAKKEILIRFSFEVEQMCGASGLYFIVDDEISSCEQLNDMILKQFTEELEGYISHELWDAVKMYRR